MWSLPNIERMNEEAATNKQAILRAARTGKLRGKKVPCDHADYDGENCHGEVYVEPWYDIFSDDPKGVLAHCEYHRDHESIPEGYFLCNGCGRILIENYTWEFYRHDDGAGTFCLPCYAENELADDDNWIALTPERIAALSFHNDVRKAKHLIGVRMPIPKGIEFQANVEMDGSSGGRLTGFSSCESGPDGAVSEVREILTRLMNEGYTRAILICDGAYQFSVSIGIYTDAEKTANKQEESL